MTHSSSDPRTDSRGHARGRARTLAIVVGILLVLASCSKKVGPGSTSTGIASWYGHPFDGRLTASGEVYNMEKMTAAHKTFAFGTVLRVENLVNGKKTEVRINDRGPFVKDRIIDLSHAAAQSIDMPGVANVRLQVLSVPPTRAVDTFAVQVGAFSSRPDADRVREQMERKYGTARVVFRQGDQSWRVLVGSRPTLEGANALAKQLDKEGTPGFVVLSDSD